MTAYFIKLPGSENFPIFRYMLIGIAKGPPGGFLLDVPGVQTHTYLKGEPVTPILPPPPTGIDRAYERISKGFLQWERDYDSLDIGAFLGFP